MAKKGQKFKSFTLEEKEQIVAEYAKGISSNYLEKHMVFLIIQ